MSETRLHGVLRALSGDLSASGSPFALAGGLAVSARTEPRFTRDIDVAISVASDREAENLVRLLVARGYRIHSLVEQEAAGRLATARLLPPGGQDLFVGLLFASSGIEPEIIQAAEPLEVIEGLTVRVASLAHLIAMKVLARDDEKRPQDRVDLLALLRVAGERDLQSAREALELIRSRGFHRGKDLLAELEAH
jgi:predicted nucleotidyltransferase